LSFAPITPFGAQGLAGDDLSVAGEAVDHGPFRPVARQIQDQASRQPDQVAICYADQVLTYAGLDRLANGIAIAAAGRGVTKGDRVASLLVNSLEQPAAYLALLKLGAVLVPMDPGWPAERLRLTLRVLAPRLILCADTAAVPEPYRDDALAVTADVTPADQGPDICVGPDDLAYGFFTSGTTGTPKCALNRHGGLVNRLRFMTRYFGATGGDVVLQNSKFTFDSSLWQLLWPLTTGGRTVLPAYGEFLDLQQTIDTIGAHQVTATDFVSSIFNICVDLAASDDANLRKLASLRYVVVGSEEINARAVHRMRAMLPGLRIANGYGPTETSIGMVFHCVSDADGALIPLGQPIDNCYVAVLGEDRAALPRGTAGEIAIGGACVGAGYHGNDEATGRAFIPNHLADRIPGERLYLSGDFGYLDAAGQLYFGGRKDFQVKVAGVRIELGEIEAAAQHCPGVTQAKVVVAERDAGKSLALFAAASGTVTVPDLREYLRRTLPRTSVPRYVLLLAQLPLSEGGKVDWRALRTLLDRQLDADAARLAAATAGPGAGDAAAVSWPELTLRAFRVALGQPDLGAGEDFMEAGGDSLRALAAVRLLTDEFDLPDLCALDLIEHPTARDLGELISARQANQTVPDELAEVERDAVLPGGTLIRAADPGTEPRTVLVTGATGFVGSRVVYELLVRTDLRVRCLVRAADDNAAAERVVGALTSRDLWQAGFAERIEGFAGDLGLPGLGLSEAAWAHLAQSTDLVLHNGALVNLVFGYAPHRPANVAGTAEVLRLAMTGRPAPLHYVSTLSAVQAQAGRERAGRERAGQASFRLPEIGVPSPATPPVRGYSRSKWVAERYLAQARQRGAVITVLRLGEVLPARDHVHPNQQALTHLLLSAIVRLGLWPDAAIRSDYTPVDYAAARVVSALLDRDVRGRTLHVFHPDSVSFAAALAGAGAPVERTSCAEFLTRLREAARLDGDRQLAGLAALTPAPARRDEDSLRGELDLLLTDNASLYRKDECRRLERRWQLTDPDLAGPIAAYYEYLARAGTAALSELH
jgi:amino acid adenylation domain-containing protein/thioester reductase-like protein